MKRIITILVFLLMGWGAKATQLAGNYAIPGTYPNGFATVKQAVDSLNGFGISSAVTINIASGYTENEIVSISLGSAILNNTLNSTNTLTFKKSGVGQNPLIIAYVGTISNNVVGTMGDCIFSVNGCDYVTIDGIDVLESVANTTATTQMEFGYAFYKLNIVAPFDGCQNNTIKNCSITLNQANIYSVGILFGNTKRNSFATIIPASTFDANNYNKIYNNAIQNVYSGIYFKGFNDTAAIPNQTLYDTGNDIGGDTITTGNTITNWGGDFSIYPSALLVRYGIYCSNQIQANISFNLISNFHHLSPPNNTNLSTKSMYGIYLLKDGENFIIPNNLLVKENTVELKPIMFSVDSLVGVEIIGYHGGININRNDVSFNHNLAIGKAYQNICFNIKSSYWASTYGKVSLGTDINFTNNRSTNDTINSGNFSLLNLEIVGNRNLIKNNRFDNSSIYVGTIFRLTHKRIADTLLCDSNFVGDIHCTGTLIGFKNTTSSSLNTTYESYKYNKLLNISTSGFVGIWLTAGMNNLSVEFNNINNISGGGTGLSLLGGGPLGYDCIISNNSIRNISNGATGIIAQGHFVRTKVTKNIITDLSSNNSTSCKGLYLFSGGVKLKNDDISNNIIGNFSTPFSTSSEAQIGMEIVNSFGVNVQNNTIYLSGTVPNNLFGSAAIKMFGLTAPQSVLLRNNLIINATKNVGANPTGIICGLKMFASGATYVACSDSSNNNIWYAGNPSSTHLIYTDGQSVPYQTLQSLQAAIYPVERNSKTENTLLFTSNPASSNYLHVNNFVQTLTESGGLFDSIVKDDFDGNIRFGNIGYTGNGTAPDIGAGEFNSTISNVKVNAGRDTFICGNNTVILGGSPTANNGSGHYHYYWNPSTGLNNDTIPNPVTTPNTSTSFVVSVYDSISNLTFTDTVNIRSSNNIINQTICNNQPYFFKGLNLLTTGTYIDTLTSVLGCDSIIVLNLFVGTPSNLIINQTVCNNYFFNNQTLTLSGTYYDTLANYLGCDSIITLNLIVNPISNFTISQSICNGSSVLFNFQNFTTNGVYYDTLTNYLGCDSIVTLILSVNNPSSSVINQIICSNQPYYFKSNNLTTSGTYLDTLTNYLGCDSIITLNLTVLPISNSTINQIACNNYSFNNQTLTTSGTYYDTLTNYLGCDSIVTLNLIVNQKPKAGFSVQNFNIGQPTNFIDSSFLFSANPISQYLWSFGDSINMQTSNAQNPLHTYSVSGNYLVQLIVNDINGCGDTSQQLVAINNCINAPNIISTNIFPAGTQCVSIARLVTAIVNFNTSIQKNVWLKYSINGVLQTSILASNSSGNIYSCTMPSSTPTNGKIIWWITADTGNICSSGMYGGMYQDSNFVNLIATSTASANPICLSSSTLLNYTFNGGGNNYTYTWFDGISIIGSSNPIAVNPTINTSYNLIVKDTLNQCFINSNQIFVTVINPTLSFAALSQSCFNPTTCVSLSMNANNGVAPYTFNASSLHGGVYNSTNKTICYSNPQQDTITVNVTDANGCTAVATDTIKLANDCVWPGDANSDLVANNLDIFPIGLLNGTTGPIRNNASLVWIDQPATPFGTTASGFTVDAKHADCNGDGIIDGNDTTAILQNYGLTHLRIKSGADLMTLKVGPDTLYQNTTATIHIGIGTAALPVDSVYGVAFSFNVDPTAIDTNSININTPASWLFNNATDHFQIYKISKSATRVDVGLVRNNHISKSGYGDVVTVTVDITTGNIIGREDAMAAYNKKYQLHCSVDNITILKLDGTTVAANIAQDSSLVLYNKPDGINNILTQNLSQSIIPNPATNSVSIKLKGYNYEEEKKLILIDATGRLMLQKSFTSNQTSIDISELNQGIYIAKIISEKGITESKLIKQ